MVRSAATTAPPDWYAERRSGQAGHCRLRFRFCNARWSKVGSNFKGLLGFLATPDSSVAPAGVAGPLASTDDVDFVDSLPPAVADPPGTVGLEAGFFVSGRDA